MFKVNSGHEGSLKVGKIYSNEHERGYSQFSDTDFILSVSASVKAKLESLIRSLCVAACEARSLKKASKRSNFRVLRCNLCFLNSINRKLCFNPNNPKPFRLFNSDHQVKLKLSLALVTADSWVISLLKLLLKRQPSVRCNLSAENSPRMTGNVLCATLLSLRHFFSFYLCTVGRFLGTKFHISFTHTGN